MDRGWNTEPSLSALTKVQGQRPYLIPAWSIFIRSDAGIFELYYFYHWSEVTWVDVDMGLVGDDPYEAIEDESLTLEALVLNLASLCWSESWAKFEQSTVLVGSVDNRASIQSRASRVRETTTELK